MKKLVVLHEETTSTKEFQVAEFLSMQYNYGLYDFNPDKLLKDLEEMFGVKEVSRNQFNYDLEDENGGKIKLIFKEEYV